MKTGFTVLALACLLSACWSGGLCARSQSEWSEMSKKIAPCGYQAYQFSRSTCDQDVAQCTDQDLDAVNKYYDCLDQLPTCDPGNPQAWNDDFDACGGVQVTNQTCRDAWYPSNV